MTAEEVVPATVEQVLKTGQQTRPLDVFLDFDFFMRSYVVTTFHL